MKIIIRTYLLAMLVCGGTVMAQQLQYSRQNVFIQNPDEVQVVPNISGMHHLLSFSSEESVTLFIFNHNIEFNKKLVTPFKLPLGAQVKIIAFADFYYIFISSRQGKKYLLWKVYADGSCMDKTLALEKLLQTQQPYIESGFQLMAHRGELCLMYHTYVPNLENNVLTMVMADSLLNVRLTKKAMYEFKESGEKLLQEEWLSEKELLVLKATNNGMALKIIKVEIVTGKVLSNEFFSSGYYFTQSRLAYNQEDSAITVTSLLTEPNKQFRRNHYVFVSRLNRRLEEEIPFKLLKTQFRKNTGNNFILVNNRPGWLRFKTEWNGPYNLVNGNGPAINSNDIRDEQLQAVRFSRLDKSLKLANDSLMSNRRHAYTVKPAEFVGFSINNMDYLLVAQQFFNKGRGLLLVKPEDEQGLSYKYLPVKGRYDYLLHRAVEIPQQGILIPYFDKVGAGLLKVKF